MLDVKSLMFLNRLNFSHLLLYNRIVADNVDHNIYARVQTKDQSNRSLHWTHQYALLEKVIEPALDDTTAQKSVEDLQLTELLPDHNVQNNLNWQWAVLVSRVIAKYLPAFKGFQSDVIYHIPHKYSEEMAQKSDTVSIHSYKVVLRYMYVVECNLEKREN